MRTHCSLTQTCCSVLCRTVVRVLNKDDTVFKNALEQTCTEVCGVPFPTDLLQMISEMACARQDWIQDPNFRFNTTVVPKDNSLMIMRADAFAFSSIVFTKGRKYDVSVSTKTNVASENIEIGLVESLSGKRICFIGTQRFGGMIFQNEHKRTHAMQLPPVPEHVATNVRVVMNFKRSVLGGIGPSTLFQLSRRAPGGAETVFKRKAFCVKPPCVMFVRCPHKTGTTTARINFVEFN